MSRIAVTRGLVPLRALTQPVRIQPIRSAISPLRFDLQLLHRPQFTPVAYFSQFPARFKQETGDQLVSDKAIDKSTVTAKPVENSTNEQTNVEKTEKEPSKIVKLYQQTKKLMTFYKDGIKLLWANHKTTKSLKEKVSKEGHVLTRDEFQLIHLSEKDMIKLIPFAAIFLILAESIPLVVMFAPGLVPSTCVTPSQMKKQREKMYNKRLEMSKNVVESTSRVEGISVSDFLSHANVCRLAKRYEMDFDLANIDRKHLSSYCRFMGLPSYGTQGMLRKRLDKYLDYIVRDDKYIAEEGVDQLDMPELEQAAEERGMRSVDVPPEQLRKSLQYWISLSLKEDPVIPRGLLVFSRLFLLNATYDKK
ncbi:LETM1-like protein-domain-containing protein [Umbelopsis sp. AD052]|nr:LETM1-like protein-domain-containing protein [Umbelopsis sp. AD052]